MVHTPCHLDEKSLLLRNDSIAVGIPRYRTELVGDAPLETALWNEVQKRHLSFPYCEYLQSTTSAFLVNLAPNSLTSG